MIRTRTLALLAAASLVVASCGRAAEETPYEPAVGPDEQSSAGPRIVIAVLGDSLTAGLGLLSDQAYPAQLQRMFDEQRYDNVEILNAGVSGDTTAGGLRRVEQVLQPDVKLLAIALGANDAIRGLTLAQTHDNLAGIIDAALERNVVVLLIGMEAPTNLGDDYRNGFRNVYTRLAAEYRGRIGFIEFLLEGVAGIPALNQQDGVHPNEEGAKIIAGNVFQILKDFVDQFPTGPER